jgi:hypothetical protein
MDLKSNMKNPVMMKSKKKIMANKKLQLKELGPNLKE